MMHCMYLRWETRSDEMKSDKPNTVMDTSMDVSEARGKQLFSLSSLHWISLLSTPAQQPITCNIVALVQIKFFKRINPQKLPSINRFSPSGWFRSLGWGVSHTGSPSPVGSILHVHQVDPQVLHVVLHDVDPHFSLSSPTPLSTYICLQDSPDTILLFSALCMPKPSQPGLPYFVRDARYSEDATDIVIPFLVSQRKAENPS